MLKLVVFLCQNSAVLGINMQVYFKKIKADKLADRQI
jgi:hypothetical protein